MYLFHTSTQALGGKSLQVQTGKNLLSQILLFHIPHLPHSYYASVETLRGETPSSACPSLPKLPENPGPPPGAPIATPYLRSVLSAREMAGFLTALEQAALLLWREKSSEGIWGNSNSVMGTPLRQTLLP